MNDVERLLKLAGFPEFRWAKGVDLVVAQWVRLKCTYACESYGTQACCPPNVPSVAECGEFFRDYERLIVIHIEKAGDSPEGLEKWKRATNAKLLELERDVFLAGFYKAMVLFPGDCSLCAQCVPSPKDCRHRGSVRPTPEALAVDVFATARKLGYPIEVLSNRSQIMNRYALLLVE
jgi:predicted metal-binding protein